MGEDRISECFRKLRQSVGNETLINLRKKEDRKVRIDEKYLWHFFANGRKNVRKDMNHSCENNLSKNTYTLEHTCIHIRVHIFTSQ